jgi:hypothetical protein
MVRRRESHWQSTRQAMRHAAFAFLLVIESAQASGGPSGFGYAILFVAAVNIAFYVLVIVFGLRDFRLA